MLYIEQRPATPSESDPSILPPLLPAAQAEGNGAPGESPGSVLPPDSEVPQPNATETNFFTAGCRVDADCGATRRCEFAPPASSALDGGLADAGLSDGGLFDTRPVGPPPVLSDAGPAVGALPDAGASDAGAPDAASQGPPAPPGRCVPRVASTP